VFIKVGTGYTFEDGKERAYSENVREGCGIAHELPRRKYILASQK